MWLSVSSENNSFVNGIASNPAHFFGNQDTHTSESTIMFIHCLFILLFIIIASAMASADVTNPIRHDQAADGFPKHTRDRDEAFHKKSSDAVTTKDSKERNNMHVERITKRVRTTLDQVDIDQLQNEELIFLEDAWKTAFQTIFGDIQIRSIIITEDHPTDRKMLRGRRKSWYDVWAVAEFYACSHCGYDDDDEYDPLNRYLEGHDDAERFHYFDKLFCRFLHDGPLERFHGVERCQVEFSEE
jgi:hypothetical protein